MSHDAELSKRRVFITQNPLEKKIIIDSDEKYLISCLDTKTNPNKYYIDREMKEFLKPIINEVNYFVKYDNTKIEIISHNINNNIKFISKGSDYEEIKYNHLYSDVVLISDVYFQIYNENKLIYEIKLNNIGVIEKDVTVYEKHNETKEQIVVGKYNVDNRYRYGESKNINYIMNFNRLNGCFCFKHLTFYNPKIKNKIKELLQI
jgi:hypothetical protein